VPDNDVSAGVLPAGGALLVPAGPALVTADIALGLPPAALDAPLLGVLALLSAGAPLPEPPPPPPHAASARPPALAASIRMNARRSNATPSRRTLTGLHERGLLKANI
jgi:hypothetical protein